MTDFIDLDGEEAQAPKPLSGGDSHGAPTGLYESPRVPSEPARGGDVPPEVIGQGAEEEQNPEPDTGPALNDRAAEAHVLSCLLLDPSQATLPPEVFHFPEHRLLYLSIRRLLASNSPVELASIAADLSDKGQFTQVGQWPFLFQIEARDQIPTTLHLRHYADRITAMAEKRSRLQHAQATIAAIADGRPLPAPDAVFRKPDAPTQAPAPRSPLDFTLLPRTDRSVLLGNRYLNRGDGLVLSSQSGMGKSSIQAQMAKCFALGRSFHGIPSNGPLKSLIVQSEDSDGDIAEVWQSMAHVEQWTPEQRVTISQNVRIVSDRINRGDRFLSTLKAHIAAFKPDLVWINPLQAFVDGDVTDSQDLGAFLREGLNGLNAASEFAYILIHHTTKPATGKDRSERLWHEVMYDMAGGAEIINWARAIISLRPSKTEGEFVLKLAKRGRRAGVTKRVEQGVGFREEPCTEIQLKHATGAMTTPAGVIPLIYWEASDHKEEEAPKVKLNGRPEKHLFETYHSVFPTHTSEGKTINQLWMALKDNGPVPKNNLHEICAKWRDQGHIEILEADGMPRRYRRAF